MGRPEFLEALEGNLSVSVTHEFLLIGKLRGPLVAAIAWFLPTLARTQVAKN
jgi:hypothetical protein